MPTGTLKPGGVCRLGANVVRADLTIVAPDGATFTASLNGGAPVTHVLRFGGEQAIPVNSASVVIAVATTGAPTPPAGGIILNW